MITLFALNSWCFDLYFKNIIVVGGNKGGGCTLPPPAPGSAPDDSGTQSIENSDFWNLQGWLQLFVR